MRRLARFPYAVAMTGLTKPAQLHQLVAGQVIPFGGDRYTTVSQELAESFCLGDRLVVVQDDGALLRIPQADHALVRQAVAAAHRSFVQLGSCSDEQISTFYEQFAALLEDEAVFAEIANANAIDVDKAISRQRSTTRLALSTAIRVDMIAGLRVWRDIQSGRNDIEQQLEHERWTVTVRRSPLGVVGFVFEGRPNVFADAAGVLRSGNSAVLRIGSDALATAKAIMAAALRPALLTAGLPSDAIVLIDSEARATGWALFSDDRLSLAVARGSGQAVQQLGAVARQSGIPASLHGTGGSWMMVTSAADPAKMHLAILNSLDRKVCNTLNVCCVNRDVAESFVPLVIHALEAAAASRSVSARLHIVDTDGADIDPTLLRRRVFIRRSDGVHDEPFADIVAVDELATEWEWEDSPEMTLVIADNIEHAVQLFNQYSPRLAASLISESPSEHERFRRTIDAPFVGNGMTRWVDGQFALNRPELGLSNWANGRLLARSAVLSGDSVFTLRTFSDVHDSSLRR